MKKFFPISISLAILLIASGCSTPRHNVTGTTYGWSGHDINILSDIRVSNLSIRHVRMPLKTCTAGYMEHLELNGEIGPDSTYVVGELLNMVARCVDKETGGQLPTPIFMNSNGGLLKDGYSLGRLFRQKGTYTIVGGEQVCASACAVAFLGGNYRGILYDGSLLFHSPYIKDRRGNIVCTTKEYSSNLKDYFQEMLNPPAGQRVYDRAMDYCSTASGWIINKDAAAIFKITNT